MAVALLTLINYLDDYLESHHIKDYCPNGLQVQGRPFVNKIVTGVTASQALIEAAIEYKADALLVHHGYFWRNEDPCIVGMKHHRLKLLLEHDVSLIAYHLPLDVHLVVGNNVQLATRLGLNDIASLCPNDPSVIGIQGILAKPATTAEVAALVAYQLERTPLTVDSGKPISKVGLCTGGGQGYIDQAIAAGVDLYITGEASEQTYHSAIENGISFIAAGHHATERYGIKALGEHLAQRLGIEQQFVDIDNPF